MFKRLAVIVALMLAFATVACATAEKGTIGVSLQDLVGNRSLAGVLVAPFDLTDGIDGVLEIKGQSSDGYIRGDTHVEIAVPVNKWDVVIFNDGGFDGYEVENLEFQSDTGLALDGPDFAVGTFSVSYRVGVFGRNAGDFTSQSARDILLGEGFADTDLDMYEGLGDLKAAPLGLKPKNTGAFGSLWQLDLSHPDGFSTVIQAKIELIGDGDRLDQLIVSPHVDVGPFGFTADFGFQRYQGEIESERAWLLTYNKRFDKLF